MSLTPSEREALTRGDVYQLYNMGVHAYLLNQLSGARRFGVSPQNYQPRLRGEVPVE